MSVFSPEVVQAVLSHMNDDHTDDNLLIVRAFAGIEPTTATMVDLDHRGGTWSYTTTGVPGELRIPWSRELSLRPEIRAEIVLLYDEACDRLGVEPRPHS
ncbi:DUF2470 domain-containing protein [Homoserinibacter sp. GY 40078]|uniref:DUF2470 domain-containing protein n=1 Tax=Homoserinibacter sp. GY 40078 TaxID=2603275 RepID=UPI0011CB7BA4|nr:DUF2470 domain-containing protein [Homoserinibacter sp. GY 40078]TXK18961.1 DUF2470 domain-containing protein [Homoserinibacter sp. GY 40078]